MSPVDGGARAYYRIDERVSRIRHRRSGCSPVYSAATDGGPDVEELERVYHARPDMHFVEEAGARREARVAEEADDLPLLDLLSLGDAEGHEVGVPGDESRGHAWTMM